MLPDDDSTHSTSAPSITITCAEVVKSFRQLDSLLRIQRAKIDDFIASMITFFDLPTAVVATLVPLEEQGHTHTHTSHAEHRLYGQSDTFLKLILRIESIQDPLIEVLLGKMLLLTGDDVGEVRNSNAQSQVPSENERLATQIFNHIRWCELLFSPEKVVKTCIESLLVLPTSLQIEVIISIPAILTASVISEDLLGDLLGLAQGTPSLLPCILETVGNLCLSHGSEVHKQVVR